MSTMEVSPHQSAEDAIRTMQDYDFFSLQLRNNLISKWAENQTSLNGGAGGVGGDRTDNFTCATNISETYEVDPNDLGKIDAEMLEFKNYLSAVKFNWMEVNVKRRYVSKILSHDVTQLVSQCQNDELDKVRASKKSALKATKAQTVQLDETIQNLSTSIDSTFPIVQQLRLKTDPLLNSISELELELRTLRNSRTSTNDMTVSEAEHVLQAQEVEMTRVNEHLQQTKQEVVELKTWLGREKKEVEKLSGERDIVFKNEQEAKRSIGGGGGEGLQIAEACKWYAMTTDLYKHLLGIVDVKMVEEEDSSQLFITYDLENLKIATLCIEFDPSTQKANGFKNAKLIDSMEDISDIVQAIGQSGDVPRLVKEVLARITV